MARKRNPRVVRHPAAIRDLIEIANYLARTASLTTADRFLIAADQTITRLARMPGLGTRWDSDHPRLADIPPGLARHPGPSRRALQRGE